MIEFENLEEVAADLSKKTIREEIVEFQEQLKQQPGQMKAILCKGEEHSVREILEHCLSEADETQNIIVMRFKVEEKHDGNCEGTSGSTMMVVNGRHAAAHAMHILGKVRDSLGQQLANEFFREQMKEAVANPGNSLIGKILADLLRSQGDDKNNERKQ